jgi:hypothetical protein
MAKISPESGLQVKQLVEAIRDDRIDEADELLQRLTEDYPDEGDLMVFGVVLAIQRGLAREALRSLEELPGDQHEELKVLCLRVLGEPHWEGMALELAETGTPTVRKAMREMLCLPAEDEILH